MISQKNYLCYNCKKPGHWAHQWPRKKYNPKLVALFDKEIEPEWWDLNYFSPKNQPDGNIIFIDPSKLSDETNHTSNSSSNEFSDLEPLNWKGDSEHDYFTKQEFEFFMFTME